jgi:hypothetical protein
MSKRNKVNPGQYTQAGRLSADDAAREHSKQNQPGIGSRDTPAEERERTAFSPAAKPSGPAADTVERRDGDEREESVATPEDGAQRSRDKSR